MTDITLSDDLRRFIHTIESIPHLEAMLLLRQDETLTWDENLIAKRLYLNPEKAKEMLADLSALGICIPNAEGHGFVFAKNIELIQLIDQLANYYSHHLIEVTNIIHANTKSGRRIRLFADAFDFKRRD